MKSDLRTMHMSDRYAKHRANQARIIEEATERLVEVLYDDYGITAQVSDRVKGMACYIIGLEGDGGDEEYRT